jgi:uroporphyrinogen-III decarboxylase
MSEMTGLERALTYLRGERPDKMPIWHESVYLAWKYSGVSDLNQYMHDAEAIARGHINHARKFGVDITGVNIDQWVLYEILGAEVEITPHIAQPKIPPWRYRPDRSIYDRFKRLKNTPEFDPRRCKRAQAIFKAWKIVNREIGDEVLLRQGILGPLGTVSLVVGVPEAMRDIMVYPDLMQELLEAVTGPVMDWTVEVAYNMVEAVDFSNFCMGFSAYDRGLLDAQTKEILAEIDLEYLKRVRERIGRNVPITTHVCSYDPDLDFIYEKFGREINEMQFFAPGSMYPLSEAVRKFGDKIPLCAGIDNIGTLYAGSPSEVEDMVKNSIELGRRCKTFALGPGCGLSPGTPEENLLKVKETRDKYGVW